MNRDTTSEKNTVVYSRRTAPVTEEIILPPAYLALATDSLGLHGDGLPDGAADPQLPGDAGVGPSQRHHGQEVVEHHQHRAVAATRRC